MTGSPGLASSPCYGPVFSYPERRRHDAALPEALQGYPFEHRDPQGQGNGLR